ncbi:hypothetical protein ACLOJK_005382 [Asimina triloba]
MTQTERSTERAPVPKWDRGKRARRGKGVVEGDGRERDRDIHYGRRGEEKRRAVRAGMVPEKGVGQTGGEERRGGDAKLDPRERGGRKSRERGGERREGRDEGKERGRCVSRKRGQRGRGGEKREGRDEGRREDGAGIGEEAGEGAVPEREKRPKSARRGEDERLLGQVENEERGWEMEHHQLERERVNAISDVSEQCSDNSRRAQRDSCIIF